jgi:CheY-like chemotaxis protein
MSRVLIADLQAAPRKALTKLLRSESFEVECVADGQQLLEKLRSTHPNLVMLDLEMPGQNGVGLLEMVRMRAGHVPVVMTCKRKAMPGQIPVGAADCIPRPFDAREVVMRVRRALGAATRRPMLEISRSELHDPETGRIDAKNVAEFLGVPLAQLVPALEVNYPALHKTPDAPGLQVRLRPIKRSIDLVSRITLSPSDARAWLNCPHPDLGGSTPLEVILEGKAGAIVTMLSNAMAGIPS